MDRAQSAGIARAVTLTENTFRGLVVLIGCAVVFLVLEGARACC